MQVLENEKIKERMYIEKLENGLTVMIMPKKEARKKYIIWGTHYGSNDNKFIVPGENKITEVPKGVAHFLEHKMFEQENGANSLDVLSNLGVNANAYTTNNHTAYLYECTENFYEALDEFMDYIQHPYFTDENVEKEKGIIGQEIMMYDDYPEWKVYLNLLEAIYHTHPVKLDITGTVETISKIDKDILYKCYNTFYNPENMCMVICGDFEVDKILEEIKKRLIQKKPNGKIERIFEKEEETIVKNRIEQKMEVTIPLFAIGIKCKGNTTSKKVKRHIAIEILLNMLMGESSSLYQNLYKDGILFNTPSFDYEFEENYAHILITGASKNPEEVYNRFCKKIQDFKDGELNKEAFERIKKMVYGECVKQYNDVGNIAKMFLSDFMKGINSFEYLDNFNNIEFEYVKQILDEDFDKEKMVFSVVKNR